LCLLRLLCLLCPLCVQTLCLEYNRIPSLPLELGRLKMLQTFHIGVNDTLKYLPVELLNLKHLDKVL
jgi:hypothetical protein